MLRKLATAFLLASACLAAPALAQSPASQPPITETPESDSTVVITARKEEEAVRAFVAEIGEGPKGVNLSRWDRRICVGVTNVTPAYAQQLIDRVSLVAVAVGLEPGEPGCKANVLILATTEGDALATRMVKDHRRIFHPLETVDDNLGEEALETFQKSGEPVRWWHVSRTVMSDTGQPVARGQTVHVRGSGRLRNNVRQELSHALIILDTSKIGTVSFITLADYVAMVALAQVDADADLREFPSIMNMFAGASVDQTARMTDWDLDYLTALYETPGDAASAKREANHIARNMLKED